MSDNIPSRWWRFSLTSLILAIAFLSVVLAVTLSGGRTQKMGRTSIYARHYGWPIPYLRVPTGDHTGKVPADLFVPGLIIDLVLAVIVVAAILFMLALIGKKHFCSMCPANLLSDCRSPRRS